MRSKACGSAERPSPTRNRLSVVSKTVPADYVPARRTLVQAWARILRALEGNGDLAFDTDPDEVGMRDRCRRCPHRAGKNTARARIRDAQKRLHHLRRAADLVTGYRPEPGTRKYFV